MNYRDTPMLRDEYRGLQAGAAMFVSPKEFNDLVKDRMARYNIAPKPAEFVSVAEQVLLELVMSVDF